ncbi:uridine kinase family protein [Pseudactinotalea suaedae]|jgi:uridine kinase|uniref:uridine kinase family protein n=1 Tax=Pseudactinotalea suaedae TaxID=1524924 RepID=UPI001F4F1249|nr:uridine kinase [Pseudactinotalea suaedae]
MTVGPDGDRDPVVVRAAEAVLAHALRSGASCGDVAVVIIDGPAGSGKTTVAARVEDAARARGLSCAVVHMDDLYEGWEGMRRGGEAATRVLRALASGEPASYRRYHWVAERYVETVPVPPVDLLVIEGVGSARLEHLDLVSTLVWVEEPDPQERLRRGIARDGAQVETHWRRWMVEEAELFAEVGTRERADVHLDGLGTLTESACS